MTVPNSQRGATLIEVLVAFLVLSLGLLSLSGVMAYSIQMPKLAAYRATAVNLAASHVERIRANPTGFQSGGYARPLSYDGTSANIPSMPCSYPYCTAEALAAMDSAAMAQAVRAALPAGGMLTTCTPSPCTALSQGDVWIVWQEPSTFAALNAATSDECPREVVTAFKDPVPRCVHVRFAL
jgi:type IV pilus assembly protein PilV